MRTNTHTHTLKVCSPPLIDQNNVAAVTFSLGRNYLSCLCLSLSHLYVHIGVSLFFCLALQRCTVCVALINFHRNNNCRIFMFWLDVSLGFSSAHACTQQLYLIYSYWYKHWLGFIMIIVFKCLIFLVSNFTILVVAFWLSTKKTVVIVTVSFNHIYDNIMKIYPCLTQKN